MPRNDDRRNRHEPTPSVPRTLSLPAIPPEVARRSGPMPNVSAPSASRVSRPMRAVRPPPPDTWDDEETDYPSRSYPSSRDRRSTRDHRDDEPRDLVTQSRGLPALGASSGSRALGPMASRPMRATPPPRPIKRSLFWQLMILVIAVITIGATLHSAAPPTSAMASAFEAKAATHSIVRIVDQVPILTQIDPTIGYLDDAQYQLYSGASCSAAATSSVLLAWGNEHGRIGNIIVEMGKYLDPHGGLQSSDGFKVVAEQENFNVEVRTDLTAAQVASIVNDLGIPVIVGVRELDTSSYYRYFAPGHFLVVTGADANGFDIVDNSTYYVHYLPTATFMSLWSNPRSIIFYPKNYTLNIPSA